MTFLPAIMSSGYQFCLFAHVPRTATAKRQKKTKYTIYSEKNKKNDDDFIVNVII